MASRVALIANDGAIALQRADGKDFVDHVDQVVGRSVLQSLARSLNVADY